MKPHDPNAQWCLEHRDLIALWLERRGGWRRGDWCVPASSYAAVPLKLVTATSGLDPGYAYTNCSIVGEEGKIVWIPTAHDMLEMLSSQWPSVINMRIGPSESSVWGHGVQRRGKTLLIALMESLKALEEVTA